MHSAEIMAKDLFNWPFAADNWKIKNIKYYYKNDHVIDNSLF